MVDEFGIISTLAGNQFQRTTWKPLPCVGSILINEVQLNWPTDLAINPLDGSLHFIDDDMVLQLTKDGRINVVAGRPSNCHPNQYDVNSAKKAVLNEPQSVTFSMTGDMFVAESDSQRINRVRKISSNLQIETLAGKNSNCNCLDTACKCYDHDIHLAASTRFSSITSIAISPDGILYVSDQGNYRIRAIASLMPTREDDAVFEVPDPDSQELYVFNKFGQHIQTKDIMTDNLLFNMEYHQSTSNGKLISITDSSSRKLSIIRDYSGQVTALETSHGQKHNVKINRMGYLESFERPDHFKVEFQYYSSTGLLQGKLVDQNYGFMYKYDEYGRLIQSVSPTGEITYLAFILTSLGGNVRVGEKIISINENKVSQSLSTSDVPLAETSLHADKSLTIIEGQKEIRLKSVQHLVIRQWHPVIGDSYPMIGELNVEVGQNLISKIEWDYTLQSSGHEKKLLGINKKIKVNGNYLLSISYDKLQRREVLLLPDKTELLEIKYDEMMRPVTWVVPSTSGQITWAPVSQRYDRFGHLVNWKWGDMEERYIYDQSGRLHKVEKENTTILIYNYDDGEVNPKKIRTGSGNSFILSYDIKSGGLDSMTTPGGNIHKWTIQPDIGYMRWNYVSPWNSQPYSVLYNSNGDIISIIFPSGNERVSYIYRKGGYLQSIFSGQTEIEYDWDENTGVVNSIYQSRGRLEIREKRKYHGQMLKDQKIRIGGISLLDNANFKYQMDGTGRPSKVTSLLGREEVQQISWKYNQHTGTLESVINFHINYVGFNKSKVADLSGNFFKTIELDKYGNLKSLIYTQKRRQIFTYNLEYSGKQKLKSMFITNHEGTPLEEVYNYNSDGQITKISGSVTANFKYDENGNLVGINHGVRRTLISYGPGDRVDNCDQRKVMYDKNGFIVAIDRHKYLHNGLGQLIEYISQEGINVQYYYDHSNRLIAWVDSMKQARQYFYTNPLKPNQVTYVHNPSTDDTHKLSYDHNGHLIMMETAKSMFYIVCDHLGSPTLILDQNGNVVKYVKFNAFGDVHVDSNPNMKIPIGFMGGLSSYHATFIHYPGRVYNPSIKQWLSPDWLSLQEKIESPFKIFLYRFHNNNPLNPTLKQSYMTSMQEWTNLYGFKMDKVFHSLKSNSESTFLNHKVGPTVSESKHNILPEMYTNVLNAKKNLEDLQFVHFDEELINKRRMTVIPRFKNLPSNFGRGFLLSVVDEKKAIANPVEVQNSVVQKIFESVLNNSVFMDLSLGDTDKSIYYFVKPNMNQFALDSDTVRRLAGEFTISKKDIEKGKELSIVNDIFQVHILYGHDPGTYRNELLKKFNIIAVKKAWEREKNLVSMGFSGSENWTPKEISELGRSVHWKLQGWDLVEIQPVEKYLQLAGDGTNFEFVRSGHRNRKNRHWHRKHVAE